MINPLAYENINIPQLDYCTMPDQLLYDIAFIVFAMVALTVLALLKAKKRREIYESLKPKINCIFGLMCTKINGNHMGKRYSIRHYTKYHSHYGHYHFHSSTSSISRTEYTVFHSSKRINDVIKLVPGELSKLEQFFGFQDIPVSDAFIDENFIVKCRSNFDAERLITSQFSDAVKALMDAYSVRPKSGQPSYVMSELVFSSRTIVCTFKCEVLAPSVIVGILEALIRIAYVIEQKNIPESKEASDYISAIQAAIYADGKVTPEISDLLNAAQERYAEGKHDEARALAERANRLANPPETLAEELGLAGAGKKSSNDIEHAEERPVIKRGATRAQAMAAINKVRKKVKAQGLGRDTSKLERKLKDMDAMLVSGQYDEVLASADELDAILVK